MSRWKTGAQVLTLQLVAMASAHCGTSRLQPICLGCRPGDRHWAKIERPERCLDATVGVDRATRQEYINCLTPATGPGTRLLAGRSEQAAAASGSEAPRDWRFKALENDEKLLVAR